MQRRQLLKWIMPLTLVAAGTLAARKLLVDTRCTALERAALLDRLRIFYDPGLGKKAGADVSVDELRHFDNLCDEHFDEDYRQLVADDFAKGKTKAVDGWILSETEALTHRLVYQSAQ